MKFLILFLFTILTSGCQNKEVLKSYHDFTYEFRDHTDLTFSFEEINKIKPIDRKKVDLGSYKHLFKNIPNWSDISVDSMVALKRFPKITKHSSYDLFLVQVSSKNLLLIGNKQQRTISSFWIPPKQESEIIIAGEGYSKKFNIPVVVITDIKEKTTAKTDRISKDVFENIFEINNEGKLIFKERTFNKMRTFLISSEHNQFSGIYKQESEKTKVTLTLKDGSSSNHYSYRMSTWNFKTSEVETFFVQNKKLTPKNSLRFIYKERLIFRLDFDNQSTNLFWNFCDTPNNLPCSTLLLTKE